MRIRWVPFITVLALFVSFHSAHAGRSDSATAKAKARVKRSIKITKVSDLDFGEGFTGDIEMSISAATGAGAEFTVSGEPAAAYTITLPTSVTMTTDNGVGADKQMVVDNFNSDPAGSAGLLSAGGVQTLHVGARRAAISQTQASGDYQADFVVTVTYP